MSVSEMCDNVARAYEALLARIREKNGPSELEFRVVQAYAGFVQMVRGR